MKAQFTSAVGLLFLACPVFGDSLLAPVNQCRQLGRHGKLSEAGSCFSALALARDPFLRAEGFWGLRQYEDANAQFREADKFHPNSAVVKTEWGRLFAERFNPNEALKLFQEAMTADKNYAPAYLAMAHVLSENYDKAAVELANKALERNPKFAEAHELLAFLALEDSNPRLAADESQKAIELCNESLDGMAVMASIDWLAGKTDSEWIHKILAIDPVYGEAYATGAHFFVINRRYEEGIQYYRKALELNSSLLEARSQLGVNLMRLGRNEEARLQLERCYTDHFRDAQTTNALKLLDSLSDFELFRTRNTEVLLNKKEAALLRPYIEPVLQRAMATYERKYKMTLQGPVRLEVYPNHTDFEVRTLGLPGQGGLLGVTFGTVVAMDSPSAREPGQFNWASTVWHELSHVYVLTATNHLVPRWFTEGLAVHEEGAASPDWGDRLTPDTVLALQQKKLLPVSQLDRGFVRPEYPNQVLVSYYEAGKICDYIVEKWGDDAILGMIRSFAARKSTPEAIQENLHQSPEVFDKEFMAWLDTKTANTVQHFDQWKKGMRVAYENLQNGKRAEAIREGRGVLDYYPDYVGGKGTYELVARAYLDSGDKVNAAKELERYREIGGTDVELLKTLAHLEQELGKPAQAEATLTKLNNIFLEDEEAHKELGTLLLNRADAPAAVREFRAVIALHSADVAESHYNLARALNAAHDANEAKNQVLIALEAAPDYKPAQQLLLQLSQ